MKMISSIKIITVLATMLLLLTGCSMSTEEENALREFEASALEYYTEKYGTNVPMEKSGYVMTEGGLFPASRTADMYVICSDQTTILYQADSGQISDDKQSADLLPALTEAFCSRLESLEDVMIDATFVIDALSFNDYTGTLEGTFFHTRFDGDIDEFIATESIALRAEIFLLCEREDSWKNMQQQVSQMLERDFPARETIQLTVLSSECYEVYQAGECRYPGIDMSDCYAIYELGNEPYSYIQHYVKLTDGVYVTSKEKDFMLEEGDLILTESITTEDLNQIILDNYATLPDVAEENQNGSYMVPDKEHVNYYHIDAVTPIYKIQFSDRVKKTFGEEFSVYLRFVPEERDLTEEQKLYYFPVDEIRDYYYAFAIHTDYADAEFAILNESDYYFIGSQTKQEN